jgi:hypothetical protein
MKLLLPLLLLSWLPLATPAAGKEPDFEALIAQLAAKPKLAANPKDQRELRDALTKRRDATAELWLQGEAAWPSLRRAVAEGEDLVATAAATLLAAQQDRQSLPAIIARLRRSPTDTAPFYARAAVALAAIDGPHSLGPLHDAALGEAGDFRLPLAAALLALPPDNYAQLTGRGEDARAKLDARSPASLAVVPLVPKAFEAPGGAEGAIAPDGTVTVTGPRTMDTYTLKAVAPGGGKIIGFILEAIPDPSLPNQGPGRADDGRFMLSRFAVSFGPAGGADTPTAVKFAGATPAKPVRHEFPNDHLHDDRPESIWPRYSDVGRTIAVTFDMFSDTAIAEHSPLTILIEHPISAKNADNRTLGKFRIAVIQDRSQ